MTTRCHTQNYTTLTDTTDPAADPLLQTIGHFLLGLADLLRLAVQKLTEFGHTLIERAAMAGAVQ